MTKETKTRIVFGILAAAFTIGVLFSGSAPLIWLTCLTVSVLGWREYSGITEISKKATILYWVGLIFLAIAMLPGGIPGGIFPFAIFIWMSFMIYALERRGKKTAVGAQAWSRYSSFLLGLIYLHLSFGLIPSICETLEGRTLFLFAILVIFFGDVFAYFGGRVWGKRKIFPVVSPGKTLEGSAIGLFGSIVIACIFALVTKAYGFTFLPVWAAIFLGLVMAILGQSGDFFESFLKRGYQAKDSGALIPGHGGVLDRTDSMIFVMPLVYFLLELKTVSN